MIGLVQFFKCLSDETRLSATLLIHGEGELCVCELMEAMGESQPKISRHLAQLRSCGLLTDTRRGQWVYYSINSGLPAWASSMLAQAAKAHESSLEPHRKRLQKMSCRPNNC